ncbi:MAG: flagellar basal body rod protein FlgB [Thermotoga sp.]|nr:flagellar basal body rod protein FlgB [Thermotogota bacterium]RKX53142.1 MAG: flagellar basal body rod protein FlgB [Thermotoga sp.]
MKGLFGTDVNLLSKAMDVSLLRQQVYAHNIANVDTPHYKRKFVSFEEDLRQALEGEDLPMKCTNSRHIRGTYTSINDIKPRIVTEDETTLRNDGNNVDIDYEMVQAEKNSLRYQAMSTFLSRTFGRYGIVVRNIT